MPYSVFDVRTVLAAFVIAGGAMACASCEGDSAEGTASSGGVGGVGVDGSTPDDAAASDASTVNPSVGSGECKWEPGQRPTAALPPVHDKEYVIDLAKWQISNEGKDPIATRSRLNAAIKWAVDSGFNKIVVPPGTYLVGEATNAAYAGGVELQGDMTLELSKGSVIQMAANDRWNYCVLSVNDNSNITIRGGEIVGDRGQHDFGTPPGAHDEGHGICVWTGVDRVMIEDVELHELTGDGVLILGSQGKDGAPDRPTTNVTIRNSHIHHNRRQGVSIVGGHNIVLENNHIHHIEGTSPQFGIDVEGAGRTDEDIHVFRNTFHHNAGGDFVTSSGRNVWLEENTMIQCQVDEQGQFDASLPCLLDKQVDGPIIIWKETDNVILNNKIRMSKPTVNGFWGILGYVSAKDQAPTRQNPVGNYIAGNTLYDAGIHMAHNMRYFVANNTVHNGLILGFNLACTRLEGNRINRTKAESYKLRNVAGVARGNIVNKSQGATPEEDVELHFPMADDAPYRNSSPVFW